jgi:hypothetical protein
MWIHGKGGWSGSRAPDSFFRPEQREKGEMGENKGGQLGTELWRRGWGPAGCMRGLRPLLFVVWQRGPSKQCWCARHTQGCRRGVGGTWIPDVTSGDIGLLTRGVGLTCQRPTAMSGDTGAGGLVGERRGGRRPAVGRLLMAPTSWNSYFCDLFKNFFLEFESTKWRSSQTWKFSNKIWLYRELTKGLPSSLELFKFWCRIWIKVQGSYRVWNSIEFLRICLEFSRIAEIWTRSS